MREKFTTFIDYIDWRGDISFDEVSFCEIDAIILSQLSYIRLNELVPWNFTDYITLKQAYEKLLKMSGDGSCTILGVVNNENMGTLFRKAADSKRFGNIKLCGFSNVFEKNPPTQFGAVTFVLNTKKKLSVVAFEGTDDSIIGWHEDLTLSYSYPCKTEILAAQYFHNARKRIKGKMIIAGHSKGGNAAVYAAINSSFWQIRKVEAIYNFDGPGFSQEVLESKNYKRIRDKIYSYYPGFSVIGQLFKSDSRFKIVNSNEKGIMQHDPCSWNVFGNSFVFLDDYLDEAKYLSKSVNQWLDDHDIPTRKKFVDACFEILYASETNSVNNLDMSCSVKMMGKYSKLEPDTRKLVQNTFGSLIKICKDNLPMLKLFQFKK